MRGIVFLLASPLLTTMRDVLLIGPATPSMLTKLRENGNCDIITESDLLTSNNNNNNNDNDGETTTTGNVGPPSPPPYLLKNGHNIGYVLTNGHDGVPPSYLPYLPNLKLISCNGVGYDAIPVPQAIDRGILISHTPGVLNAETSTTALLLFLSCYRNLLSNERYARSGEWGRSGGKPPPLSRTADGRRVGILGMGRIGMAIAGKLEAFGSSVSYHSRTEKSGASGGQYTYYPNLLDMARHVECLICIVPGGQSTRHIVNRQILDALGPQGILINVARGTVVDEAALVSALRDGTLGGAGLDVFDEEPFIPEELRRMDNVVLLPHVGSATVETRGKMGDLAVDNIVGFMEKGAGGVLTPVPECRHLLPS